MIGPGYRGTHLVNTRYFLSSILQRVMNATIKKEKNECNLRPILNILSDRSSPEDNFIFLLGQAGRMDVIFRRKIG